MTEIRLPELAGGTEAEQLRRIQSYLYTLAEQLQVAFDGVNREQQVIVQRQEAAAMQQEDKREGFTAIKSLILRSADITEHFSEEIEKRLQGKFVAQSQFGTYTEETEQRIAANSQELRQEFSNWQHLETQIAGFEDALLEVSACIRTGLLYESATGPVYGVEIGQEDRENGVLRFRKFARLTSEKLSFYDSNDVEVAYISDRRLHITDAAVTSVTAKTINAETLQIGDYVFQTGADGHLRVL